MNDSAALGPVHAQAERVARSVSETLEGIFTELVALSDIATGALGSGGTERAGDALRRPLEHSCRALLAQDRGSALSGAGFAADYGRVAPAHLWMAWWVRRDGVVREKRHTLNPESDAFYDYRHAAWFDIPRTAGARAVVGPYIDSWGTDDFTITASAPVVVDDEFIGVVAADLAVRQMEIAISRQLRAIDAPAVLVNSEDRVVASGVPELTTGLRLSPRAGGETRRSELARHDAAYGWSVVLLSR
ncbi:cache domain-containing protein [Prauserella flavalba]|uniref:Cache domain-containing protein n=1 Tax=Prauserella flavalba TaxID=1477506 RepID=A0A318LCM9_9PSEU|nr:cache domain-containing protein [Prauserella flavalba]PXY21533.1 hypothetical protein BA062_31995 [Prauserella flavalba]